MSPEIEKKKKTIKLLSFYNASKKYTENTFEINTFLKKVWK